MKHVDARLIEAMQLNAQSWKTGDAESIISTRSGSIYHVDSDGVLTGGRHLTEGRTAELRGAVYRRGGPIRVDHITVGLCIECVTSDGKILVTTPVQTIQPARALPNPADRVLGGGWGAKFKEGRNDDTERCNNA